MNIDLLLRAIQFVESTFDHDYCTAKTMPPVVKPKKEIKTSKLGRRGYYNELERKRRSDLKDKLGLLRDAVPVCSDHRRISTVNLLKEASSYIVTLKGKSDNLQSQIDTLEAELSRRQKKAKMNET
ncbi:hypothetical protein JTE90_008582 [Oedothorax gibbosus]|uniref:BHLH domain-containing protein n=1 Tax=Oedothorax gibbosus TaxID=931172 RepID=A0AAV6U9L0_9ARAC|nr:hypothetical protein JTE90_008582 [Oedothorax gibbosus]